MKRPVINRDTPDGDAHYKAPTQFPIGPKFVKYHANPILRPNPDNEWESSYLYNATAIVIDGKVYILYRAQNAAKTSSIGLAWLSDGFNFTRYHKPIVEATEPYEKRGGCEDPRIVRDPKTKRFILTYTAYDGVAARLCVAHSENMFDWVKLGPIIGDDNWNDIAILSNGGKIIRHAWLKSGAIFTKKSERYNKYFMIWGDCAFHLAESDDMVHWRLPTNYYGSNIFTTGKFDWQDRLIEPGPAPIRLETGDPSKDYWVLFYNSSTIGGGDYPTDTYVLSQMLIDLNNIYDGPVARMDRPFLVPSSRNEIEGQVNKVVFTEGIVQFKGQWFLYYGQGDSELGVATAPV